MKHWAVEFQPRSLCSFDGGPDGGDGGGGGGPPSGDTGGDFFGSEGGGYYGTNDSGSFFGGDTAPAAPTAPTGGDSWTGSETGAGNFMSSDPGSGNFMSSGGGGGFYSGGGGDGAFIGPNSDFGYAPPGSDFGGWGPTAGVDYAGGPFMSAGSPSGNLGFGNAIGPAGWGTSDFGTYGTGGPSNTGLGPGAGPSVGGPQAYAQAPGVNGFPGDFNAPPGGAFGMPNSQDVGPQAGPGILGGPPTTQQGEALNPSLFGPEVTAPERVAPDDRTENVAPPDTNFGPNQSASSGWFGPSQAQAASRGTDQDIINQSNQISNEQNMFANDFGRTGADMAQYMAATNPGLAQALSQAAAAQQGFYPGMLDAPSQSAQQGFQTGGGPFGGTQGAFSGQPSFGNESTQGKGDRGDTSPVTQAYPGAEQTQVTSPSLYNIDPVAPSQGWPGQVETAQPTQTVPTVDPATVQQGYQQLAQQMQAQNDQQAMIAAQEKGEQGKSGIFGVPSVDPATAKSGYDMLAQQMTEQQVNQTMQPTADMFDAQSRGEQGKGEPLAPWGQNETIALRPGEDVISNLNPFTLGAGGGIGVPGLLSMYGGGSQSAPAGRPGGSPTGNPSQTTGPFGPPDGRPGGETSGRPGLSITVGGNPSAGRPGGPGYYQTGGAGIAPGAKGAEYGGVYGRGDAYSTGRPGTNSFGAGGPGSWGAAAAAARAGGGGGGYFYDPATGQYYQSGGRR